jgi:hypothetical protein
MAIFAPFRKSLPLDFDGVSSGSPSDCAVPICGKSKTQKQTSIQSKEIKMGTQLNGWDIQFWTFFYQ